MDFCIEQYKLLNEKNIENFNKATENYESILKKKEEIINEISLKELAIAQKETTVNQMDITLKTKKKELENIESTFREERVDLITMINEIQSMKQVDIEIFNSLKATYLQQLRKNEYEEATNKVLCNELRNSFYRTQQEVIRVRERQEAMLEQGVDAMNKLQDNLLGNQRPPENQH